MPKHWGVSVSDPLEIIFITCLCQGKFLAEWKKTNIIPVFKKDDKRSDNICTKYGCIYI